MDSRDAEGYQTEKRYLCGCSLWLHTCKRSDASCSSMSCPLALPSGSGESACSLCSCWALSCGCGVRGGCWGLVLAVGRMPPPSAPPPPPPPLVPAPGAGASMGIPFSDRNSSKSTYWKTKQTFKQISSIYKLLNSLYLF